MNEYGKTLVSLENGTYSNHIDKLNKIIAETPDEELINKIKGLVSTLGSFNQFKKQIDSCSNFCIQKDQSIKAKELIEYCEGKLKDNK